MDINLKTGQLDKLFPFHVIINCRLKITAIGKSVPKLFPLAIDSDFFEHFSFVRPILEESSFETLLNITDQLIIISYQQNTELYLRGQIEYFEDIGSLMFIVTPWFNKVEGLKKFNIGLNDFAIHDSTIDLLHSFKAQEIATDDAKQLSLKLQDQKTDLKRLSLIAEETFNSVVVTDNKARIQWVNRAFETLTGYSLEESKGKTPGSLLQGEGTDPETVKYLRGRIEAGLSFDCELINYSKSGRKYWIRLSGQPMLNKNGEVEQFFAFEEDITERKHSETKLEEQRIFYEDVLNNIPSDVAVFDRAHRYLFVNPNGIKDLATRKWIIGKKDEDFFAMRKRDNSKGEERRRVFNNVIASKKMESWEEELTTKDGKKEYHLRNMYPVIDESSEVKIVIGYGLNITERKLIEQQLQQKEKRYRDLFNYCQALICTHDLEGRLLSVNPALCDALGYKAEEMLNKMLPDFIPEKDKPKFKPNYLDKIVDEEKADGVFRVLHKNGSVLFLLYKNYHVEEPGESPYIIGFSQDITDRIKAEQELLIAKKMTEDSARAKEIFLANMSHEIRTPMHGILGITGLLAKTNLDSQQKNYLKLVTESANNLVVIINDILDIEKIASGKLEFEHVDFTIADKLNTTLQSFQYKAQEKGLQLELYVGFDKELVVNGDPYRLSQILNNLISNAMKFTKKGKIIINSKVIKEDGELITIQFDVKDTGIGIPLGKLSIIFDPFVQASSDTTRKYGGTGLGLAICKNLVQMQGGTIAVDSTLDVGTVFSFTVPYKIGQRSNTENNQPMVSVNINRFAYKRILMAEDVTVNQFLARVILESSGFELDIADNGIEAIELHSQNKYDLILMDIQMPEMDGVTATKQIRQMEDTEKASIPIIALTANALVGNEQEYFEAGMNASLTKPFTEEKLFAAMNNILNPTVHLQNSR